MIISIGIILILLVTSLVIVGYPLGNILEGQLESNILRGNSIRLDNFTIFFEENSLKDLQDIYHSVQDVEFSVCLLGNKNTTNYEIISLYVPETYEQSYNHVSFESCSNETLIMLHSHPYKSCLASLTDLDTLRLNKQKNPEILMVIMCEPARFSVYR